MNPHQHSCGSKHGDINWEEVDMRRVSCNICGRIWKLTPKGWSPTPVTRRKPKMRY